MPTGASIPTLRPPARRRGPVTADVLTVAVGCPGAPGARWWRNVLRSNDEEGWRPWRRYATDGSRRSPASTCSPAAPRPSSASWPRSRPRSTLRRATCCVGKGDTGRGVLRRHRGRGGRHDRPAATSTSWVPVASSARWPCSTVARVLSPSPWTTPMRLLVMSRAEFVSVLSDVPAVARKILVAVGGRLRAAHAQLHPRRIPGPNTRAGRSARGVRGPTRSARARRHLPVTRSGRLWSVTITSDG